MKKSGRPSYSPKSLMLLQKLDLDLGSKRVVVAEDDVVSSALLRSLLTAMGFGEVRSAAWQEINRLLDENQPPCLIISDWNMPNVDGLSLLQRVRGHEATHHLPFVMLTGVNEKIDIVEAAKCGVTEYITKPFPPDTFVDKIINALVKVQQATASSSRRAAR